MQTTINTVAGIWTRVHTPGRLILIESMSVASCELRIVIPGRNDEQLGAVERGFKARMTVGEFSEILVKTTVDASVGVIISDNDIDLNFGEGATVTASISGPLPLPVSNDRGSTPLVPVYTTGVASSPATSSVDNAAVACSSVLAVLLAADGTRRQVTFTNLGPDPVAIGTPTLTWAKRAIVLNANDSWVEETTGGPNLAWSAICDAGKTASVTTKTVIA